MIMDVGYMDADVIETLNFLRPPVKRNCRKHQDYNIGYVIGPGDLGLQARSDSQTAKSSLSLILQKTCKKQIFQKYSYRHKNPVIVQNPFGRTNTNKPTVKVTVVPKIYSKHSLKLPDKNKHAVRKYIRDLTPSFKETTATKNVFLVVAGNKEDKIYEIRTVGSKTFKHKAKDVKNILENRIISSKMENKRKKVPKFDVTNIDQDKVSNLSYECTFPEICLSREEYPGTSRVKIVGRIGLNENDKYVMKCAATVNGQPVATNYDPDQHSQGKTEHKYELKEELKKDKALIRFSLNEDKSTKTMYGKMMSQATQIDANVQYVNFCSKFDRTVQCNMCDKCTNTIYSTPNRETKTNSLHRSTSPLVIISVYPKSEMKSIENSSLNSYDTQNYGSTQKNVDVNVNNLSLNADFYKTRDQFPNRANIHFCCPCEVDKKENIKIIKKIPKSNVSRSVSPSNRSPISKAQEHKKNIIKDNVARPKSRSPSPNRLIKQVKQQKDISTTHQSKKPVVFISNKTEIKKQSPKYVPKLGNKNLNTVKVPSASDLAGNTFSKKVHNNKKNNNRKLVLKDKNEDKLFGKNVLKRSFPKNNSSKVSINIESDKEFYDLMFEKGSVGTDFTVKRTGKDNIGQKYFEEVFDNKLKDDVRNTDSLENFFLMEGVNYHRRSVSQAFNATEFSQPHPSSLHARDSLEIGHRREHSKDHKSLLSKHKNYRDGEVADNGLVRTKHFPGDDCSIRDPLERDKEIRELLGIDKKRKDKTHNEDAPGERSTNNDIADRCTFQSSRCKDLITQLAIEWACSTCNRNIGDNQTPTPKREEEKSITDDEKQDLIKLDTVAKIKRRNVLLQARVKIPGVVKQQSTQFNAREMDYISDVKHNNNNDKYEHMKSCQNRKIIQLTRKQYRRIKKTIYKANANQRKWGKPVWNSSFISLGSVKAKRKSEYTIHWNKDVQTDPFPKHLSKLHIKESVGAKYNQGDLIVFFPKETKKKKGSNKIEITKDFSNDRKQDKTSIKKVASSLEIRYASIKYHHNLMNVEHSITDVNLCEPNLIKRHDSIETLFRGHKKSHTPNLGTSALSFLSEEDKPASHSNPDLKSRKPFLRRLMSCLVMRSQTTQVKLPSMRQRPPTLDSSADYHISTSLGGIDMSSSLYDTTASFYSNHTIGAINNRTKRGFFTSVRGFLTCKIRN